MDIVYRENIKKSRKFHKIIIIFLILRLKQMESKSTQFEKEVFIMKRQNKLWIMQFLLPVILVANMVSVAEAGIATGNGTAATEKQVVIPDTRETVQNKNADENIKVGIDPDKEKYDADENMKVYISIENISKNYLDEIQVEPIVPEGMEVEFTDNEIGEDLKSGVKLYATMKITADESKQTESTESRKVVKRTTSDSKSEDIWE